MRPRPRIKGDELPTDSSQPTRRPRSRDGRRSDGKSKAVGTGPFTFAEWVQDQYLRFEKNQNYWQTGRPYLDGVRVNIKTDAVAMVTELEAGASDIVRLPVG